MYMALHGFANQPFGIDSKPVLCPVAVKARAVLGRGWSSLGLVLPWVNLPRRTAPSPCELLVRAQPSRARCVLGGTIRLGSRSAKTCHPVFPLSHSYVKQFWHSLKRSAVHRSTVHGSLLGTLALAQAFRSPIEGKAIPRLFSRQILHLD